MSSIVSGCSCQWRILRLLCLDHMGRVWGMLPGSGLFSYRDRQRERKQLSASEAACDCMWEVDKRAWWPCLQLSKSLSLSFYWCCFLLCGLLISVVTTKCGWKDHFYFKEISSEIVKVHSVVNTVSLHLKPLEFYFFWSNISLVLDVRHSWVTANSSLGLSGSVIRAVKPTRSKYA